MVSVEREPQNTPHYAMIIPIRTPKRPSKKQTPIGPSPFSELLGALVGGPLCKAPKRMVEEFPTRHVELPHGSKYISNTYFGPFKVYKPDLLWAF